MKCKVTALCFKQCLSKSMPTHFCFVIINKKENNKTIHKNSFFKCLMRLGVLRVFVLLCVGFYKGHFVMVPLILTHLILCFQHYFYEYFSIYIAIVIVIKIKRILCENICKYALLAQNVDNENNFIKKFTEYIMRRHLEAWQSSLNSSSKQNL